MDVYRERAHLLALLAAVAGRSNAWIAYSDPAEPDWPVLTIVDETGQMCWHLAPSDLDLFDVRHVQLASPPAWDGHSTEEKYERLRRLIGTVGAN